jgi:hypothetical protein
MTTPKLTTNMLDKYIEAHVGKQIDRYHLIGISIDDFLDFTVKTFQEKNIPFRDISKEDFELHKRYSLEMSVEGRFSFEHYVHQHESLELEQKWKELVMSVKRI